MPSEMLNADSFSSDALEFIRLLQVHAVRYLVVGGEAVIYYGYPRLTGDIDFYYEATKGNADRLFASLKDFWEGDIPGVNDASEFLELGTIIQFGRPPNRIDLLNTIDGVTFEEAWASRIVVPIQASGRMIGETLYIGKDVLLKNKKASGRAKDLDDVENLT